MAYLSYPSVRVVGVSACVPKEIDSNWTTPLIPDDERSKLITSTGIEEKRVVPKGVITSDLCLAAAERLIDELGWNKEDIEALVFVSQTPDYILPATACLLQDRLGLSKECLAFDISLGCSGWVYGMNSVSSMVSNGSIRKALLLCGDITTRTQSYRDKTSYPLFGDAGTATAVVYDEECSGIKFHLASDGSGYEAIIITDGGYRNQPTEKSLQFVDYGDGKVLTPMHVQLDGMTVFSFAISKAPKSVKGLCERFNIDFDQVDNCYFHQANLQLNETVRKKLKLPEEKVPYSLKRFANSSGATIPVTMVTERQDVLRNSHQKNIACAFGVGLSWGTAYFETDNIVVPDLVEI